MIVSAFQQSRGRFKGILPFSKRGRIQGWLEFMYMNSRPAWRRSNGRYARRLARSLRSARPRSRLTCGSRLACPIFTIAACSCWRRQSAWLHLGLIWRADARRPDFRHHRGHPRRRSRRHLLANDEVNEESRCRSHAHWHTLLVAICGCHREVGGLWRRREAWRYYLAGLGTRLGNPRPLIAQGSALLAQEQARLAHRARSRCAPSRCWRSQCVYSRVPRLECRVAK